ncbi:UDP-N-acetylmuramoyl-tripeptide--D-alanyl-D-alanine ligase [Heyndrickxia ginsengihumi]|uniref:UDP-N-acetylmuramoyl-tripeptide--D-alanyl-D- alanine ligase n=1 Tax=Heyndrickxia ginsengihumi TaxID=363870 RepID=UPI003D23CB22
MIKRTIQEIVAMINVVSEIDAIADITIQGVSIDSRKIEKGNLYIPLKGSNVDGHKFVEDAIRKGAAASLWQKDVPNPPTDLPLIVVDDVQQSLQELAKTYRKQLDIKVVGITGSNGKTTTKDMVSTVLSQKYKVQKTEGNYNNHLGLPLTILSLDEDTDIAVLEMGMSARGEISLLTNIARPDVAIITNIGEAHIQNLGSRRAIADAKLEIVEGLPDGGLLIYIGDEPLLQEKVPHITGIDTKTFGRSLSNDVYPVHITQQETGSSFKTNLDPEVEYFIPVLGEYNVVNALSAISVGKEFSLEPQVIASGLQALKLTAMRMEMIDGIRGSKVINDAYNASPTSMKAAIHLIENFSGARRKILVLGDMLELGENEKQFHTEIGQAIDAEKIQFVFTYGELARYIAEGARDSFPETRIFSFTNKDELIQRLQARIEENDLILVKASRGMKLEDVVKEISL